MLNIGRKGRIKVPEKYKFSPLVLLAFFLNYSVLNSVNCKISKKDYSSPLHSSHVKHKQAIHHKTSATETKSHCAGKNKKSEKKECRDQINCFYCLFINGSFTSIVDQPVVTINANFILDTSPCRSKLVFFKNFIFDKSSTRSS